MEPDWKIVLIDDDPGIRRVMAAALRQAGYRVFTAPDGPSGLDLCREQSPQIVITDVGLPGLDGLEVLRRIKETAPDTEVIVATAFTEIALAIKAMQLDASGFVTKPVASAALVAALGRARERYTRGKRMLDYTALLEERWMDTAEELARMFQYQNMLIEGSMDGIVACDRRGKVIIFNPRMEELLHYEKGQVIGRMSLLDFFAPGEAGRFQDALHADDNERAGSLSFYRAELIDAHGQQVPAWLSASALFQEDEQVGMVVFVRKRQAPR
jgi:PAS domain S-box-containing protein